MRTPRLPNLYSIGPGRSGSTTLHSALDQHPLVNMSSVKEPRFWEAEFLRVTGSDRSASFEGGGQHRTPQTYAALFDLDGGPYRYLGESSHYLYKPKLAGLMAEQCGEARILICLRDPIARLVSEYRFRHRNGKAPEPIDEWVTAELSSEGRVRKGLYAEGITAYRGAFGEANVHALLFEDLIGDTATTLRGAFDFLGLPPHEVRPAHRESSRSMGNFARRWYARNRALAKPLLPRRLRGWFLDHVEAKLPAPKRPEVPIRLGDTVRAQLQAYYREDLTRTGALLGRDLRSRWSSLA